MFSLGPVNSESNHHWWHKSHQVIYIYLPLSIQFCYTPCLSFWRAEGVGSVCAMSKWVQHLKIAWNEWQDFVPGKEECSGAAMGLIWMVYRNKYPPRKICSVYKQCWWFLEIVWKKGEQMFKVFIWSNRKTPLFVLKIVLRLPWWCSG